MPEHVLMYDQRLAFTVRQHVLICMRCLKIFGQRMQNVVRGCQKQGMVLIAEGFPLNSLLVK